MIGQMTIWDFLGESFNNPINEIIESINERLGLNFKQITDINTRYYRLFECYVNGHRLVIDRSGMKDSGRVGFGIDNRFLAYQSFDELIEGITEEIADVNK